MDMISLEKTRCDLNEEIQKVNEAIVQVRQGMEEAKKELADLEVRLPDLVFQHYLGKLRKSEVVRVKRRRNALKESLEDYSFILKGLESELLSLRKKEAELESVRVKVEGKKKRIEVLKERIKAFSDSGRAPYEVQWLIEHDEQKKELVALSSELGCLDDAQKFLDELKTQKTD